jgi:hypothetical protein
LHLLAWSSGNSHSFLGHGSGKRDAAVHGQHPFNLDHDLRHHIFHWPSKGASLSKYLLHHNRKRHGRQWTCDREGYNRISDRHDAGIGEDTAGTHPTIHSQHARNVGCKMRDDQFERSL